MSLEEVVKRLSELEQERSRDKDMLDVLRKFGASRLQRHLKNLLAIMEEADKKAMDGARNPGGYGAANGAEKVREALRDGADPNQRTTNGETLLHMAASSYDGERVVDLLLASKAAVDAVDNVRRGTRERAREKEGGREGERETQKRGAACRHRLQLLGARASRLCVPVSVSVSGFGSFSWSVSLCTCGIHRNDKIRGRHKQEQQGRGR